MGCGCQGVQRGRWLKDAGAGGDPVDLLEIGASQRARQAAFQSQRQSIDDYARDSEGRMIIRDEAAPLGGALCWCNERCRRSVKDHVARSILHSGLAARKYRMLYHMRRGRFSLRVCERGGAKVHTLLLSSGRYHAGCLCRCKAEEAGRRRF
jgi:hypothetical protein